MPKLIKNAKITILQKAKSILLERGLSSLNMRALAAEAGVAAGTLYNYFSSKEDLITAVLTVDFKKMLAVMNSASSKTKSAIDGLEIIFNAIRDFSTPYDAVFLELRTTDIYLAVHSRYRQGIINSVAEQILPLGERHGFLFDETVAPFLAEALLFAAVRPGASFARLKPCIEKIVTP